MFHGRSGVDGLVGDDFLCCFMFIFFHDGVKWCRYNATPVQCSECQSGEIRNERGQTTGETMTLIMVTTSALNVKVVPNKLR